MCIRDSATPLLNIPSELLGALVCGLLIRVPMKIGKLDVNPLVNTFVSTCVSGFTFAALSAYINVVSVGGDFAVAMAAYVAIVLGTEGDGLAHTTIAACDYTVRIPMSHGVDSLNVAAASAVAFWQLGKQ